MRPCFDIIMVEISTIASVKSISGLSDKELTFSGTEFYPEAGGLCLRSWQIMPCYTLYIQCTDLHLTIIGRVSKEKFQERIPSFLHEKLKAIIVGKRVIVTLVSDAGTTRNDMMAVEYTVKNNRDG